jgi:hypothetical protein
MSTGQAGFTDEENQSWTSTTLGYDSHLRSGGISRGQWDRFMSWGNSQTPTSPVTNLSATSSSAEISPFITQSDPLTITPHATTFEQLGTLQAYSSVPPPGSSTLPVSFGQSPLIIPHFEFTSPVYSSLRSQHSEKKRMSAKQSPTEVDSFTSPDRYASESPSSDDSPAQSTNLKKRKASINDDDSNETLQGNKKSSHNMIEKRYRNNLNDKIAALRDSVPALRVISRTNNADSGDEDLEGLTPAHKLNKATVLSKATEYIKHLQKQKNRMEVEIAELKNRVASYERMIRTGGYTFHSPVSTPDTVRMQEDMFPPSPAVPPTPHAPPQGLIPIPESIANLRRSQMGQAPYSTAMFPAYPSPEVIRANAARHRPLANGAMKHGSVMGRVMLGGLTTLMLAEGFIQREQHKGNELQARGLFSAPFSIVSRSLETHNQSHSLSTAFNTSDLFAVLRVVLILSSCLYIIAPLFNFKANTASKGEQLELRAAESVASPIESRQKAWLTAIQTVWVPRHSFILEAAALFLKTLKLSTRKLIGWNGYAILTGGTKEQEAARVKAWGIAIDAQLTGGDAEVSMSRLILTLLASGTLPSTPARLMLKSLHIRVLMWEAANTRRGSWLMLYELSTKLARSYWNAARAEYRKRQHIQQSETNEDFSLPDHLAALLELDSDEVLVDSIIQRAYNLAWNKPTAEGTDEDDAMDSVVEDVHIASPLDALAAWWSTFVINRVLVHSINVQSQEKHDILALDLDLAVRTSPPPSSARIRALVTRAVLISKDRSANIFKALAALPQDLSSDGTSSPTVTPKGINFISEAPLPSDIPIALTLAKCLALADSSDYQNHLLAASFVNRFCPLTSNNYSLLSFAAGLLVLERFANEASLLIDARMGLEHLANSLRLWIGHKARRRTDLLASVRPRTVQRCLNAGKAVMGVVDSDEEEGDAGYVSQGDHEDVVATTHLEKVADDITSDARKT